MNLRRTTTSAEETQDFGRELAAQLQPGTLWILSGPLGGGKTTLVKGLAEGLRAAAAEDVTSPTFNLIHEYCGPQATIFHIDLYRLEEERELLTLALDDLMSSRSILLIEWGEKFPSVIAAAAGTIVIKPEGDAREIAVISSR